MTNEIKNLGFETYKIYRALKFHFNTKNYDFKTYKACTAHMIESWNDLPCREIFSSYSKKLSLVKLKGFFIANFLLNLKYFPTDYNTEFDNYLKWVGNINSIKYNFEKDLKKIKNFLNQNNLSFKELIISKNGKLPIILYMVFKKIILMESFIIIDNIFMVLDNCEHISSDNRILYDNRILLLKKYKTFFNVNNIREYKILIKNIFSN